MMILYPPARNDLTQSDNCSKCGDDVSIIHLNIVTGLCTTCNRERVRESNKEFLKKAREYYNAIESKKITKQF
jgi:hypothetical protein